MRRGEIWLGVWLGDPQRKPRPLLIVSNNLRNQAQNLLDINVVKLTSLQNSLGKNKAINPSEDVVIKLKKATIIRCASIFTIEKTCLFQKIALLTISEGAKVDACLKTVLDLNEPELLP